MKYRTLPVEIEAVQWDGTTNLANSFLGENYGVDWEWMDAGTTILIQPQGWTLIAEVGDWLVRQPGCAVSVMEDAVFRVTYEPVEGA